MAHDKPPPSRDKRTSRAIAAAVVCALSGAALAAVVVLRLFRRPRWGWLWLPPVACLTAAPLLYGLAAPEDGIGHGPGSAAVAAVTGGAIGLIAATAALRHRGAETGLVAYVLWVSLVEFARPWWWERAPAFDPLLTQGVLTSDTGEYAVKATFLEAGGLTGGLLGPVVLGAVVAARTAARRGDGTAGAFAGTIGPLLLFAVYFTLDPNLGGEDSIQSWPWVNALLALLATACVSAASAAVARRLPVTAASTRDA
ncbi:hypothetical protein MF672_049360 [Actinomadura sp. ATCC 31491]|uniref:Uncharacterized protein n=1 Tax=Actinomadura luzonensis TaxID=2805427 RepID=A0ABT0GB15_9ACTN|nr:hypothetical protein [Actinomadura luzonensis]MCK2221766.1 hypothetical protein [Actinomadura luzonensis]